MEFLNEYLQYGLLGIVLSFLGTCIYRGGKWTGKEVILPLAQKHISYLETCTEAISNIKDDMEVQTSLDEEMKAFHKDPNSTTSTVHTNKALLLLSSATQSVAEKLGIDTQELHDEIGRTLSKQK